MDFFDEMFNKTPKEKIYRNYTKWKFRSLRKSF